MATGGSPIDTNFKPGKEQEAQPTAPPQTQGQTEDTARPAAPPAYFDVVTEQQPAGNNYPLTTNTFPVHEQPSLQPIQQQLQPTPNLTPAFPHIPPMPQNAQPAVEEKPRYPGPHTFETAAILLVIFAALTNIIQYWTGFFCIIPAILYAQKSRKLVIKTKDYPKAQKKANIALGCLIIGGIYTTMGWVVFIVGMVSGVTSTACRTLTYSSSQERYVCT